MTKSELDEYRLARSMGRLMQLQPPRLAPVRRNSWNWFQTAAISLGTAVVMAAVIATSIVLHDRSAEAPPGSSSASVSTAPSARPVNAAGVVTTRLTYAGTGARLDPPGAAMPLLSAATVLRLCSSANSKVACETGPPESVDLGVLTDTGMHINDELVWAMTWTRVNCDLMGPANRPSPRVNDATGCDFVTFVDAKTGDNPEAIRGAFGL